MKHPFTLPALATGLSIAITSSAQVSFGGLPMALNAAHALPEAPVVTMPAVDAQALIAEDEVREATGIKGPYRFGSSHAVDLGTHNSGLWHELPDGGRVWRLAIECPGALSINFEFHDYVVPEGARVFVYNEAGGHLGAFTAESSGGQASMGVTQLAGDRITIEYIEPRSVRGMGSLRIGYVTHAYRDVLGLTKGLGDSGACNNNVICPEGDPWRAQIRSVAMITVNNGSGLCTGQLLNNCAQDGTPYFITAQHCLPSNRNIGNWVYRFNWHSPTCATNTNGPTNQTVAGSQLLAENTGSDMGFIRFNNAPPANYNLHYSGWDKSGTAPSKPTGIHHPRGDVKKITFDEQAAITGTFNSAECWRVLNWEDGTTEPGSSGSGLWNQTGLFVGQLFGGQATCSNNVNDYYGKFSVSFPVVQQWLGTCGDQLNGYPNTVGIGENTARTRPSIAPNPGTGQFTVLLPDAFRDAGGRLAVYDALGQLVLERNLPKGTERLPLDLGSRTDGIYLLQLTTGQGSHSVERVVLAR